MNSEEAEEIITILGAEKVEKLYEYLGSKKISFAALHALLLKKQICEALKSNKISFSVLAKKLGVSRMTLYRLYHQILKRL